MSLPILFYTLYQKPGFFEDKVLYLFIPAFSVLMHEFKILRYHFPIKLHVPCRVFYYDGKSYSD